MVVDFSKIRKYNQYMKATQITTTTGKTITVSQEQGDIIRQGMFKQTPFVTIDKQSGHIIRTSTIAEIKDVWTQDHTYKALNEANSSNSQKQELGEGYEQFKKKRQELLDKI